MQRHQRRRASRGSLQFRHPPQGVDGVRVVTRGGVDLREREPSVTHRPNVTALRDDVAEKFDRLFRFALSHEERGFEHHRLLRAGVAVELTEGT